MMRVGMMFSPWGTPFGGFWLLLIPVTIFITIGIFRIVVSTDRRREGAGSLVRCQSRTRSSSWRIGRADFSYRDGCSGRDGSFLQESGESVERDGGLFRVDMRVSDSGIMVYEFVEIRHKDLDNAKTLPGDGSLMTRLVEREVMIGG